MNETTQPTGAEETTTASMTPPATTSGGSIDISDEPRAATVDEIMAATESEDTNRLEEAMFVPTTSLSPEDTVRELLANAQTRLDALLAEKAELAHYVRESRRDVSLLERNVHQWEMSPATLAE